MGSTWLLSIFSQERSLRIYVHPPTTWKCLMSSVKTTSSLAWKTISSPMDDSGDTRDDLKCPDEDTDVGKEVRASVANETDILVTVLSACGEECVIATKVNTAVDK